MSTVLTTAPTPPAASGAVLAPPTTLPDPGSMPSEHLEAELVSHAEWEASGMARMLAVLGEFDRREVWATWECRSAQQWLSWKCGLGYTAATERLRVARVLPSLPAIGAALAAGRLSWSKVREFTWASESDGSTTISIRLPAERARTVIDTVRAATPLVKGQRWAADAADTLVHLVCGGSVTTVLEYPTGPVQIDRTVSPSVGQRRWLALRHATCQFPGCNHAGAFEAHHVIDRLKGGPTRLRNLVRLCWFHHRRVHLERLVLTLHSDRTLTVTRSDGTPIDRPIARGVFAAPAATEPGNIGNWAGDRLHVKDCLLALGYGTPGVADDFPAEKIGERCRC